MTPDLQREFQNLTDVAHKTLREVPISESLREVFSFWKFPSFTPSSRCTIYTPWSDNNNILPHAAISVWRFDLDSEKLRSPVERLKYPKDLLPTIENATAKLTRDDISDFETRLTNVKMPLYLGEDEIAGFDGTRYEFRYDRFIGGVTLRWWSDLPAQWLPLTTLILQIDREIQSRVHQNCE